jgi:hypothetical protein
MFRALGRRSGHNSARFVVLLLLLAAVLLAAYPAQPAPAHAATQTRAASRTSHIRSGDTCAVSVVNDMRVHHLQRVHTHQRGDDEQHVVIVPHYVTVTKVVYVPRYITKVVYVHVPAQDQYAMATPTETPYGAAPSAMATAPYPMPTTTDTPVPYPPASYPPVPYP